ncbi:MAG: hypothetical protein KDA45_05320 [Planctomycetales bacterium]|nr:hypothetical protein [Planctomycetales bacterium]
MDSQTNPKTNPTMRQSASNASSQAADATKVATEKLQAYGNHYVAEPAQDLGSQLLAYAKRKPDVAAMWCFGLGVLVGWKLRG